MLAQDQAEMSVTVTEGFDAEVSTALVNVRKQFVPTSDAAVYHRKAMDVLPQYIQFIGSASFLDHSRTCRSGISCAHGLSSSRRRDGDHEGEAAAIAETWSKRWRPRYMRLGRDCCLRGRFSSVSTCRTIAGEHPSS